MANRPIIQGVSRQQEIRRGRLLRDTRPMLEQTLELLASFEATVLIGLGMCACVVFLPWTFDVMPFLALIYAPIVLTRKFEAPMRKRMGLSEKDPGDRHPGTGKPMMARGIGFLGNRLEDGAEIWDSNDGMRTHMFVLGSTGAGKTEGLTSLAINALNWSSGYVYVDGKGDVNLWDKEFRAIRQYGREDDLLIINYMTGNADTTKKRVDKLSNTYNPLTQGNAASLIQLLVSLMDSGDGKGDMWKGRAISFISSLMPPLVDMRDAGVAMLHIGLVREFLPFPKYYELMNNPLISDRSRQLMQGFLYDVPGYKKESNEKQTGTFNEQFGYQQMQFTRILSSLADTYGHIYFTPQGEIDFNDVVMNRRILLVLLPALEVSKPELANLGKIVVAALKRMMGTQLGSKLEGSKRVLIASRATKAPTPFMVIFDEFGYFMPEGSALMWAQARSLGICLVAAGQDLQAFFHTSKEETLSIVANCNTKIFGKIEDPNETYDLVLKRAGEAYVTEMGGFEMDTESLLGSYRGGREARHTKVNRIDMLDLVNQTEGQVHILVQSKIIRAASFYAVPEDTDEFEHRVNRFVQVSPPSEAAIQAIKVDLAAIKDGLKAHPMAVTMPMSWDGAIAEMAAAARGPTIAKYRERFQGVEMGISLLMAAIDGLSAVRPPPPVVDEGSDEGAGGGVQAALTLTPAVSDAPQVEAEAAAEAHSTEVSGDAALQQADGLGGPLDADSDVVFDAASVSAFGASDGAATPEFDETAMFAASASGLMASAAGMDAHHHPHLAFLNAEATATALHEIAVGMGAREDEAASIAQQMIATATLATRHPMPPKPVSTAATTEEMDDKLQELSRYLGGYPEGGQ